MDYRIILKQVKHDRNIHKRVNQFCVNRKIKTNFFTYETESIRKLKIKLPKRRQRT